MANSKILDQSTIDKINHSISQIFGQGVNKQMTLDINKLKTSVADIIKQMQLEQITKIKVKNGTKTTRTKHILSSDGNQGQQQALAAKGYLIIFKFREYLLNQSIDYRYYFEGSGGTKATHFNDNDILKYIRFGSEAIKLNISELKNSNSSNTIDNFQNFFRDYWGNNNTTSTQWLQPTTRPHKYGKIVHSSIMKQYNTGNLMNAKGDQYQVFNRGHIYEAIDNAKSEIINMQQNQYIQNLAATMDDLVYSKYLAVDNIIASQGPDNMITSTSIKSGGADLYDYYTIYKQLQEIQKLLQIDPIKPPEDIGNTIKKLYISDRRYNHSEDIQKEAQQKLLELLKSSGFDIR